MIQKGMVFLVLLVALMTAGCATTKTVTLKNGETLQAKSVEESEAKSTYVIEEDKTGERIVVPKSAVVSIQ